MDNTFMRWALTLIASALAATTGIIWKMSGSLEQNAAKLEVIEKRGSPQMQEADHRLTRVEERQQNVIQKLDAVLQELRKHEEEGKRK